MSTTNSFTRSTSSSYQVLRASSLPPAAPRLLRFCCREPTRRACWLVRWSQAVLFALHHPAGTGMPHTCLLYYSVTRLLERSDSSMHVHCRHCSCNGPVLGLVPNHNKCSTNSITTCHVFEDVHQCRSKIPLQSSDLSSSSLPVSPLPRRRLALL